MTVGFVPLSIVDAFARLGATHALQDFTGPRQTFPFDKPARLFPTTFTYFMNAAGREVGCYDRINRVGVINEKPREWHDDFKKDCLIVPIAALMPDQTPTPEE